MKSQLFTTDPKQLSPYIAGYRELLSAEGWVGKTTGQEIKPFTAEQKILWLWMLDRYQFFKESGREWFDNQIDISAATNISESTIKRFIKKLKDEGYITVFQTRVSGHKSNSYTISADLVLIQPIKKAKPLPEAVPALTGHALADAQAKGSVGIDVSDVLEHDDLPGAGMNWATEVIPDWDDRLGIQYEAEVEYSGNVQYGDFDSLSKTTPQPSPIEIEDNITDHTNAKIENVVGEDFPARAYKPNGDFSDVALDWLEENSFFVQDAEKRIVIHNVKGGKWYRIEGRNFLPTDNKYQQAGTLVPAYANTLLPF
ncbi:winged helix-turn-helix transcriptional regulator [Pseudomonas sp. 10C3]|uniref:DUF6945 domain-containing protein n=1 Tax=Pseudomonas sp. 10C3 TaxID=3118753 RepID=UPI002E8066EA|nr:winged helix-turn-helix transcriptional regulator [Pseudomonas sp. 10C3]MEE3505187.1 winged helix-turn-helix transcriptional regulator [Pseudomonas sp. 10C3]